MLSDHIRTLLRDHDCIIIPDFGGLIAEYAPARIHPVRHTLTPPAKRVAFNQSLTRNDGLLVDALSAKLNLSTAQARQLVREAVLRMEQELETGMRTELSGVGTFRRTPGRGLEFEYTGGQNLLSASFGLPELVSRPVRATDALLARERPTAAPLLAASRSNRATRAFRTVGSIVIAGLVLSANYFFADMFGYLPEQLRLPLAAVAPVAAPEPAAQPVLRQQAALGNPGSESELATAPMPDMTPAAPAEAAAPAAVASVPATKPVVVARPAVKATVVAKPAAKPAVVAAKPVVAVAKPAVAAPVVQTAKAKAAAKPATKAPGWEKAAAANATNVAESATIKSRTGRYFIVAGSYTSLANAEKGRQALLRLGHQPRVILPAFGSRQYMLSVADFPDRASADRQASLLRKRLGDLWIKNY